MQRRVCAEGSVFRSGKPHCCLCSWFQACADDVSVFSEYTVPGGKPQSSLVLSSLCVSGNGEACVGHISVGEAFWRACRGVTGPNLMPRHYAAEFRHVGSQGPKIELMVEKLAEVVD